MSRVKQPFSLIKRTYIVEGKPVSVWWYRVWDGDKRRAFSLGTHLKDEAKKKALDLFRSGKLIPEAKSKKAPKVPKVPTIAQYAADFWIWDKPRVQAELLRKRLTPKYVESMDGLLRKHWIPAVGETRLDQLTVKDIEAVVSALAKKLASKSVNQIIGALKAVYQEAYRLGDVEANPFTRVRPLQVRIRARGVLTPEEGFRVLSRWENFGEWRLWALNLTAATTGARAGELFGLKVQAVHRDRLEIAGSWRAGVGWVPDTKTGRTRWIPLPKKTAEALLELAGDRGPDELVFGPPGRNEAVDSLAVALEASGVATNAQRLERGIDFHSWRHWFNSMVRGRASDAALRMATGHQTAAMTENYSHQMDPHLEEVRRAQDDAFRALE